MVHIEQMVASSQLIANMQWETKIKFFGQVKPSGIENNMSWKTGSVHFDYDAGSDSWMAKLYFKVNPTKALHHIKIGQSDNLDVKCGRLVIENKKGDGIHIRLSDNDVMNARLLVSKIKSSTAATTTSNRAEVGLTSTAAMSNRKGSENITPYHAKDSGDLSLFQPNSDRSPESRTGGLLSKRTPPTKNKDHYPTPKRRLELFSPEQERGRNVVREKDKFYSTQSFTGMKDYSKRNLHGGNGLSVTTGLGPRSFYGTQNPLTTNNGYRNTFTNSSRGLDRSPVHKRLKLSSSVLSGSHNNRMSDSNDSTFAPPAAQEVEVSTFYRGDSDRKVEVPRRHFQTGETVGFQNLGNTCFLNSPLQCLSSLEPLSLDIQSAVAQYGMELNRNSMTRKLYLLMRDVRKLDVCPENVKDILIRLRADMNIKFAPNTQQDAHELLSEVLNRVDEEVKAAIRLHSSIRSLRSTEGTADLDTSSENYQAVSSDGERDIATAMLSPNSISTPTETNFCWSYRTDIYFHECKTQVLSSQTEREMTLMLAFDSSTRSLQDCINKYFESTEVEMKCEKCCMVEKATITRKIVRRPRVFILNLLRYHSDNMEATKKADHICIPSYISIHGYCADDVKMPPHVDPVFMLDRLGTGRGPSKTQRSLKKLLDPSETDNQGDYIAGNFPKAERSSDLRYNQSDSYPESYDLAGLSDFIISNLHCLDKYLAHAQENREDTTELSAISQVIISDCNEALITQAHRRDNFSLGVSQKQDRTRGFTELQHEIALCEALLKRYLNLNDTLWVLMLKDLFQEVIEDLLTIRYDHIGSREKSLDYLIDDLGLYIAAMQCGLLKSVNYEQEIIIEGLKAHSENLLANQNNQQFRGSSHDETGAHEDALYFEDETVHIEDETVHIEDETCLKKTVSFKENASFIENELDYNWKKRQSKKCVMEQGRSRNCPVLVEKLWKDDGDWDENASSQDKHFSEGSSRTNYVHGQEKSSQLFLHGKDINLYSMEDLSKVTCSSLTEEETLIYVQAVSKLEYEVAQTTKVENISPDVDVLMDVDDSFHNSDGNKDASEGMGDPNVSFGSKCYQKQLCPSSAEVDKESVTAHISKDISQTTDKSSMLLGFPKTALDVPKLETITESGLICQEDISALDDIDGGILSAGFVKRMKDSCKKSCMTDSDQTVEPLMIPDSDNPPNLTKNSISCDKMNTTWISLDQADFDSQPFDTDLSELQTDTLFYDSPKKQFSPPKVSKTSTYHEKYVDISELSDEDHVGKITVGKTRSPMKRSAKESVDKNGDNLISHFTHSCSKKEYLFSPTKTNNLVKTRDYARLKNPAVSPKKRTVRGQQLKGVSVTKWLHYSGEDKIWKTRKCSPDGDESFSGEDYSTSELLDTSLEVNIDDASFLDSSSFIDTSALTIRPFLTPESISGLSSKHLTNEEPNLPHPTSSGNVSIASTSNTSAVEANVQQMPQTNQQTDVQIDTSVPVRKISSGEKMQDMEPESSHSGAKSKINRSLPDIEEKENMPTEQARASHLQNIEMGKADLSYKLVGIVDHTGSSQFTGHYTAYAFNMKKQKWFYLNDSETAVVTEEEVQEKNTETGYLFFYMDRDLFNEYSAKANASSQRSPS